MARAHWGVAVTTLDGTPLFGLNEGEYFRPASNTKLYTTAAAIALLGPDARVLTTVTADAPPDATGVVHGNVVLHGAGDANLSGRRIPYENPEARKARLEAEKSKGAAAGDEHSSSVPEELGPMEDLAAQLAGAGVKRVDGGVLGDDSLYRAPVFAESWNAGDAQWGYGAPVSALSVNDNVVTMTLQPGAKAGDAATVQFSPDIGYFQPVVRLTTVTRPEDAGFDVEMEPGHPRLVVRGTVAAGHPVTQELATQNPGLFAAEALASRLKARQIASRDGEQTHMPPGADDIRNFNTQAREPLDLTKRRREEAADGCAGKAGCVVLARHASPTVAEDVAVTLKVSQNLHAEMLLRRLALAYGSEATFAQGARVVRQFLLNAGLNGDDFVFYDGSGLSGHDLVTPRATAKLLAYATTQPWFAQWKAGLPVGGQDGSLASRFGKSALKNHVFAKTGTLGETRALSGYVDCASGKTLIFAVMVDNHTPLNRADQDAMDRIVEAIAAAE